MSYDWLILLGVLLLIVGILMVGGALGGFFGLEKKTDKKNWLWFIGVGFGALLALVGLVMMIAGVIIMSRSTVKTFGALMAAGITLMVVGLMLAVGGGTAGGVAEKKTEDRQWFWLIGSGIAVGSLLFILGIGLLIPAIVIAVRNKKGYEGVPEVSESEKEPCDINKLSTVLAEKVYNYNKTQEKGKKVDINKIKAKSALKNFLVDISCDENSIKAAADGKYKNKILDGRSFRG